eukprot:2838312-Amphidinium_carterae.1
MVTPWCRWSVLQGCRQHRELLYMGQEQGRLLHSLSRLQSSIMVGLFPASAATDAAQLALDEALVGETCDSVKDECFCNYS